MFLAVQKRKKFTAEKLSTKAVELTFVAIKYRRPPKMRSQKRPSARLVTRPKARL